VAVCGASLSSVETAVIKKEIIRLTQKQRPHALYIPTAGGDSEEWWQSFQRSYGQQLGCSTDVLWLLREQPTRQQIEEKIFAADLIWVGGGNTLKMMKRWRKLGVDQALIQAYERGIVLSGSSAGAICWFQYGHSDSMSFYGSEQWNYVRVRGLGLIHATHCPHYHAEGREQDFTHMIATYGGLGLALDNNAALEVIDDQYRIITSQPDTHAYKVYKKAGKVMVEEIEQREEFAPLAGLLQVR
jgi:dipeptidase E